MNSSDGIGGGGMMMGGGGSSLGGGGGYMGGGAKRKAQSNDPECRLEYVVSVITKLSCYQSQACIQVYKVIKCLTFTTYIVRAAWCDSFNPTSSDRDRYCP